MEPMTLGSPNGSPATEQYLPAFLLGDNGLSNTPKRNKLSPVQDRSLSFGGNIRTQSPLSATMHNESDRITKTMPNTIKFGPPIIDLYDDMPSTYKLANDVFTPQSLLKKDNATNQLDSNSDMYNASSEYRSPLSTSRPYQFNSTDPPNNVSYMAYRSPYMSPRLTNGDAYNTPNSMMSPPAGYKRPYSFNNNDASMYHSSSETSMSNNYSVRHTEQEFWVTIFGFPLELTRDVVEFFKHIGNHTDVHMKPNCNYISVRYSSRYEARQALTYHGALYKPGIIIGVMLSEDPEFVGKDIINIASDHIDYKAKMEKLKAISSSSSPRDSPNTSNAQQKSSGGIINKTIEYIMRW